MPERQLSVVSYAAGAGLAAIALVYVFAPTYLIDESSARRKNTVGLRNVANDCFINSVLQALAGLGELRLYLIREIHRRNLDPGAYEVLVQPPGRALAEWKLRSLQSGAVSIGLKEMLDRLNERPITKKVISPRGFVAVLERAFGQTINRQQQDAQEFLQLVAEKLKDEYHAGERARKRTREAMEANEAKALRDAARLAISNGGGLDDGTVETDPEDGKDAEPAPAASVSQEPSLDEEGFPMEGEWESQSQCQTCGYSSKPKKENFCMLTLSVPRVSSTTLSACFDGLFRVEHISDFKCDKCRLVHAREMLTADMLKATSEESTAKSRAALEALQRAIDEDPESPPEGVELPDSRYAPRRTIARSTRITKFPRVLVVHLSRSIYTQTSQKNLAKVSFPERLPLGSLMVQHKYKLLGLVTHKGGHQSGHYESFRRQNVYPPYSNPNTWPYTGAYSNTASPAATPRVGALATNGAAVSTPDLLSAVSANSSTPSLPATSANATGLAIATSSPTSTTPPSPHTEPRHKDKSETGSLRSVAESARSTLSRISSSRKSRTQSPAQSPSTSTLAPPSSSSSSSTPPAGTSTPMSTPAPPPQPSQPPRPRQRRKKQPERWWRINDEKCREAKTSEVLGMEREVYLLFYELEREGSVVV